MADLVIDNTIEAIVLPNGEELELGKKPSGNIDITQAGVTDVSEYATATVPNAEIGDPTMSGRSISISVSNGGLITASSPAESVSVDLGNVAGYIPNNKNVMIDVGSSSATLQLTTRTSSDLTASGATVSVPSGYYASNASKAVASGTEGTPTATKGTVSNHAVSVTPSVTNSAGYISGGTHTGTAVSVSASELVSGTVNITSSGNTDVTNYATASVASGGATASATKGTVSNHSVTVTPSVTRTAGYVTAGTASGTAVTVSASELVSGSQTITENGTVDVTNLAEVVVAVEGGGGGDSKNAQTAQSTTRSTSTTYTEVIALTCTKAGTYDVYWSTFRSSTSGTWGSQLYINDTAYGSAQTGSWSNHIQNIHLSNVTLAANADVSVRVRSRGSNYYGYVGTLTIIES